MPDIDLEPGDYTERKPKGWRWKLPWSHPEDTKLPMIGFFVCLAWLVWVFLNRDAAPSEWVFVGTVIWAWGLGGCMVLWLRD